MKNSPTDYSTSGKDLTTGAGGLLTTCTAGTYSIFVTGGLWRSHQSRTHRRALTPNLCPPLTLQFILCFPKLLSVKGLVNVKHEKRETFSLTQKGFQHSLTSHSPSDITTQWIKTKGVVSQPHLSETAQRTILMHYCCIFITMSGSTVKIIVHHQAEQEL